MICVNDDVMITLSKRYNHAVNYLISHTKRMKEQFQNLIKNTLYIPLNHK